MKTSFASFAAVLVTLWSTSTALAKIPAPIPLDVPQISVFEMPQFYYSETRSVMRPPRFTTFPENNTLYEGDNAYFEMRFEGDADCQVLVYHNGKEITDDPRYARIVAYDLICLTIYHLRLEDSGKYGFVVKNRLGMVEASAMLTVRERY